MKKNIYFIFFYIISCKQFLCNERTEIFFRLGNYISVVMIFGNREFCILRLLFSLWWRWGNVSNRWFQWLEICVWEKRWTFKIHEKCKTHVSSMDKVDNLVMISHEKKLDIISKAYEEMVSCSRQIVLAMIGVVVILR